MRVRILFEYLALCVTGAALLFYTFFFAGLTFGWFTSYSIYEPDPVMRAAELGLCLLALPGYVSFIDRVTESMVKKRSIPAHKLTPQEQLSLFGRLLK